MGAQGKGRKMNISGSLLKLRGIKKELGDLPVAGNSVMDHGKDKQKARCCGLFPSKE
jgi:hypothetical protein